MSAPRQTEAPGKQSDFAPPSLAYFISTYPTLSMTFVLREVLTLRQLGFRIETASINSPERPVENLTEDERDEYFRTYYVKSHGAKGALQAHLQTFLKNFAGYTRGLALSFSLARFDLHRIYLNLMYFTEALMIGGWMQRNRLHHLHVHLASQAASVGLFVRSIFGFGYSLTVHGPDEFYEASRHALTEKIAAADFIVCISSFARSQLMQLSPYAHWDKFAVVRLGVDPRHFAPCPPRPASDPFEILCVGRLTPAKGQHILIDAVDRLIQQGHRVRLRLVGGGPDEASLRTQAALMRSPDSVVFEGPVNQDRIRSFYQAADAFCLPSFAEGIPVVLMEAMAMQVPCVSTHITGIPELICNGIDGLLVPPSDLDALVTALARIIEEPVLRQQLALNGRSTLQQRYDLPHNVEQLARLFAERVTMQAPRQPF